MRILFVDQFSELGGAQLGLRDIMLEGRRRGWDMSFFAPGDGPLFRFCEAVGVPAQSIPAMPYSSARKTAMNVFRYGFDMFRAALVIRDFARRQKSDLIYVNGPRVLLAAAAASRPFIFHLHSLLDKRYSRIIARSCLRSNRGTAIAVSESVAGGLGSAVRVIYNGVADQGYLPRQSSFWINDSRRPARIGIIGRIAPEKGHLDFVRAARLMPDARFIVFGAALFSDPAYEAKVRAAASGLPVEFRGWTNDVGAALREIDIVAVPSAAVEATPRIVMEAFSAGTPVVAYPSGGIPEMVRHRDTGLLTADASGEALAQALRSMAGSSELLSRCSAHGRREWEKRFRLQRFQADIADLIANRCAERRRQEELAAV
jgi:glycosyltransferase involved in cell wall biosynthesis